MEATKSLVKMKEKPLGLNESEERIHTDLMILEVTGAFWRFEKLRVLIGSRRILKGDTLNEIRESDLD